MMMSRSSISLCFEIHGSECCCVQPRPLGLCVVPRNVVSMYSRMCRCVSIHSPVLKDIIAELSSSRRRYRWRRKSQFLHSNTTHSSAPGVSILRPLKGLDTNLYENLESTFNQEYPNYEIIFSVADERDQALPLVQSLISRYPDVKATVIIGKSTSMPETCHFSIIS